MEKRDDPSNPSGAYARMSAVRERVGDILEGPDAIRAKGQTYLPKYESEDANEYKRRLTQAPWLPEFEDILGGLASKPFTKDITLADGASSEIVALAEDIDGRGNNLTAFARPTFRSGIAFGMVGILVDNTGTGTARTRAEERRAGVRPYWLALSADDIIDLKTAFVGGREVAYHVRLKESVVVRDGYDERVEDRIRELNRDPAYSPRGDIVALGPPTWALHRAERNNEGEQVWVKIDEGAFAPLDEIPLALFWTGDRKGSQEVQSPLAALADKQIELYRALSRKDEAYTKAGFPMLTANGLRPPAKGEEKLMTGPGRVLYAPAQGASWDYIQPEPDILKELRAEVEATRDDMRRLGLQPLMPKSGGVTATASAIDGARAQSAVQTWALAFKDVLEQALVYTARWIGQEPNVEVSIHTDFLAGITSQPSLDALAKAREAKDLSRIAYLTGLIRLGVLPGDFDMEADEALIATELEGLEPEETPPEQGEEPPED